jgi:hypothetical protein
MRQRFGIFINIEKGLDQKMPRMILGILKKAYSPGITLPKNLASGKLQALASSLILLMMATRDEWCQNTLEFFFARKNTLELCSVQMIQAYFFSSLKSNLRSPPINTRFIFPKHHRHIVDSIRSKYFLPNPGGESTFLKRCAADT